ncbi:Ankyrin [Beutenbergia cavernae DSM 12333]|uniref:Ankyrin n=1 Tax=Beutenbergia cavernae (strain ATCC BAA-8 / DSM 12333 / CCUG 43141 / JCM 11478 / NBRC 16432 / NCIMB 13614 / HKI 0122) TaxID=471853 RepID=C5BZG7_BEUC1|nr:ankyrin repeat domain-containing protein [Beutenbergia cavernae]ACQ79139.1 Ankyrin [Beutenbergia cavernae DSM 12333]
MQIDMLAKRSSYDELVAAFRPGDESADFHGTTLLHQALGNGDLDARYAIAAFLLDAGADPARLGPDGYGVLHVLFGQNKHDLPRTVELTRRLLDGGARLDVVDDRRHTVPLHELVTMKLTDADLAPLYDVVLAHRDLGLDVRNAAGLTPLDLARNLPYRADLVRRLESHDTAT